MVRVSTAVWPLSCCLHLGVELLYSGVSPQLWATELSTFMDQRSLHSSPQVLLHLVSVASDN